MMAQHVRRTAHASPTSKAPGCRTLRGGVSCFSNSVASTATADKCLLRRGTPDRAHFCTTRKLTPSTDLNDSTPRPCRSLAARSVRGRSRFCSVQSRCDLRNRQCMCPGYGRVISHVGSCTIVLSRRLDLREPRDKRHLVLDGQRSWQVRGAMAACQTSPGRRETDARIPHRDAGVRCHEPALRARPIRRPPA
jgi:hypothetical protein